MKACFVSVTQTAKHKHCFFSLWKDVRQVCDVPGGQIWRGPLKHVVGFAIREKVSEDKVVSDTSVSVQLDRR